LGVEKGGAGKALDPCWESACSRTPLPVKGKKGKQNRDVGKTQERGRPGKGPRRSLSIKYSRERKVRLGGGSCEWERGVESSIGRRMDRGWRNGET